MYTLPPLPYAYDALEPYLDTDTMNIHHTKHHQTYINNVNAALEKHPDMQTKPLTWLLSHLDRVPEDIRNAVRNNGGGHFNHALFWTSMTPEAQAHEMPDALRQQIEKDFGSVQAFKDAFVKTALGTFGSGWAWLVVTTPERSFDASYVDAYFNDGPTPDVRPEATPTFKKLAIMSTPNQDTPLEKRMYPILGLDVWEHAYYLKYQNKRADYIAAWFNVVDWQEVARRLSLL